MVLQSRGEPVVVGKARRRSDGQSSVPSPFFRIELLMPRTILCFVRLVVQGDVHIRGSSVSCHARRTRRGEEADGTRAGAEAENCGEEYSY